MTASLYLGSRPVDHSASGRRGLRACRRRSAAVVAMFSYADDEPVLSGISPPSRPERLSDWSAPAAGGRCCQNCFHGCTMSTPPQSEPAGPISGSTTSGLREKIGVVERNSYMFPGTIRHNIAYDDQELFWIPLDGRTESEDIHCWEKSWSWMRTFSKRSESRIPTIHRLCEISFDGLFRTFRT